MQRQILFWTGALVFMIFLLWLLSGMLLPFVAGMIIAYLLDPVADRLERGGMSRFAATGFILIIFALLVVLAMVLLLPALGRQLYGFAEDVPGYVDALQRFITYHGEEFLTRVLGMSQEDLRQTMSGFVAQSAAWAAAIIRSVLSGGQTLLNVLSLLLVTPVVAFYLLLDWDKMIAEIDALLPRRHAATIREIAREIDRVIAGFIRGQGAVCVLLGLIYATGLIAVGLDFGLLIGFGAGLLSFIPYFGTIIGFLVSTGLAIFQFWPDWRWIAAVIAVFAFGQFIEGNILQPKLVGGYVGLHPVWLIFSLLAFASLFGFVGVLLAVPVAAAIGVLIRFALRRYAQSSLYTGVERGMIRLPHEQVDPETK